MTATEDAAAAEARRRRRTGLVAAVTAAVTVVVGLAVLERVAGPDDGGVAVGRGYVVEVPSGWTLLHRGDLGDTEGVVSCLAPESAVPDPTVECDVELAVGGVFPPTRGPGSFWSDGAFPCWAQGAPSGTKPAQIDSSSVEEGTVDLPWGTLRYQRVEAACADGTTFRPEAWWSEDWSTAQLPLHLVSRSGRLDVAELLSTLEHGDSGELVTRDGRVDAVEGDVVRVAVYRPEDGPVGAGEPGGRASYEVADSTTCLLHDTEREPGQDLRPVGCAVLLGWLSEHVGERPYVTVVTEGEVLLQVRTLYVP